MAAYRRLDDLRSPAGWLPVHRDQLRAQRSVSSMGSLYLLPFVSLTLHCAVVVTASRVSTQSHVDPGSYWDGRPSAGMPSWCWVASRANSASYPQRDEKRAVPIIGCSYAVLAGKVTGGLASHWLYMRHSAAYRAIKSWYKITSRVATATHRISKRGFCTAFSHFTTLHHKLSAQIIVKLWSFELSARFGFAV